MAGPPDTPLQDKQEQVRELLRHAAALYHQGELLAALAEWEHALAVEPRCQPARRYVRALEENYDLLDETLLPDGQHLEVDDPDAWSLPVEDFDRDTTVERSSSFGGDLPHAHTLPAGSPDTGRFNREATADQPGIAHLVDRLVQKTPPASTDAAAAPTVELVDAAADAGQTSRARNTESRFQEAPTQEWAGLDQLQLGDAGVGSFAHAPGESLPETPDVTPREPSHTHDRDLTIELPHRTRYQPLEPDEPETSDGRATVELSAGDFQRELADPFDPAAEDQWSRTELTPAGLEVPDVNAPEVDAPPLDRLEYWLRDLADEDAPDAESTSDRTRRRMNRLLAYARDNCGPDNIERAVIALELVFTENPDSASAHKVLHLHRDTICQIYGEFLGDLDVCPTLGVALEQLMYEHIDARAAFLLSRVDGVLTVSELLDVAGMPQIEALRYLSSMVLRGILILPG